MTAKCPKLSQMHQKTHIEQLNARKQEIVESCELDQIKLPTTDLFPDIDSLSPSQQTQSNVLFDFSRLNWVHPQFQELRPAEKERMGLEFKSKMESLSIEIERTAPNLKALDQYESLYEKEREFNKEFNTES